MDSIQSPQVADEGDVQGLQMDSDGITGAASSDANVVPLVVPTKEDPLDLAEHNLSSGTEEMSSSTIEDVNNYSNEQENNDIDAKFSQMG